MTADKQNSNGSTTTSTTSNASKWKIVDTPQDSGLIPTIAVTLWLGVNGFVLWIILYASELLYLGVSYLIAYISKAMVFLTTCLFL